MRRAACLIALGSVLMGAACGGNSATSSSVDRKEDDAGTSVAPGPDSGGAGAPQLSGQGLSKIPLPGSTTANVYLCTGPDGNVWYTDSIQYLVGKVTPTGQVTTYPLPDKQARPWEITSDKEGNLWFIEANYTGTGTEFGRVARISTSTSAITEFELPTTLSQPTDIAYGPDGAVWLAAGHAIGRMSVEGTFSTYPLPDASFSVFGIAAGPDGNMWFTEYVGNGIGRIAMDGTIAEFPLPDPISTATPSRILAGPDGNLWFSESKRNAIGRITPTGTIVEFPLPTTGNQPEGLTVGGDGSIWGTSYNNGKLVRVTPDGIVTEFSDAVTNARPSDITTAIDGSLWFNGTPGFIGRFVP